MNWGWWATVDPIGFSKLEYGFSDDCGIRYCYHGWMFSPSGQCIDVPMEAEDIQQIIASKEHGANYFSLRLPGTPCDNWGASGLGSGLVVLEYHAAAADGKLAKVDKPALCVGARRPLPPAIILRFQLGATPWTVVHRTVTSSGRFEYKQ